jgi:phosphoribosyl-ATP pyrophosphohydrolase/phosphoribosyl-AMP cyclohydrolase
MSDQIQWDKGHGFIPAIIQDDQTREVLMLGFMNEEAWQQTLKTKLVTFYSRVKQRLWVKGETSKNYLFYQSHQFDCDRDTVLIFVKPAGAVCHTGQNNCFGTNSFNLNSLEQRIDERIQIDDAKSYTQRLFHGPIDRLLQKIGEEAVETVLAGKNSGDDALLNELGDLFYHILVLLNRRGLKLHQVEQVLSERV